MRFLLIMCGLFCAEVQAQDLTTILKDAFKNDPTYLGAEANFNAIKETSPQAIAKLLPNLSITANAGLSHANIAGVKGGGSAFIQPGTESYSTNGYAVTLTQPLFNFAYFVQVKQANFQVKQAYANYLAASQDLIVRTTQAYFAVLSAEDTLAYAVANRKAVHDQLQNAQARYYSGMETKTAVDEARASYDSSLSLEISAKNDVENSKEALRELTGYPVEEVVPLAPKKFRLQLPKPLNVETWIKKANLQNLNLQSTRFAMMAAQKQIKINAAGHMPTLNLVTDYTKQNGDFFGTINYGQSDVGVQLAVPIFEGGEVNSQVRQARYQYLQASQQMEKAYRDTFISTRQLFNTVVSDVARLKADRQAVISNDSSLQSTLASYKEGTRTMVDVLNGIKNVYSAKQILAQDTYKYLVDTILLKKEVGILSTKDIAELNTWLSCERYKHV